MADCDMPQVRIAKLGFHGNEVRGATLRPDGWPICPFCGEDELYSLGEENSIAPTLESVEGCYRCGPVYTAEVRRG